MINAGLAQAKGRSGLLWWLGSIFLGPIATLLIVVMPKVEPKRLTNRLMGLLGVAHPGWPSRPSAKLQLFL